MDEKSVISVESNRIATRELWRVRVFLWAYGLGVTSVILGILSVSKSDDSKLSFGSPLNPLGKLLDHLLTTPGGQIFLIVLPLATLARWIGWRRDSFILHAVTAFSGIVALNWMIVESIPLSIREIGASYLIFFYHFPAAMNCFTFFTLLMFLSILVLVTDDPMWDRAARVAGQIGFVACTITVTTGSSWAKAAWGHWWIWEDGRLLSAACMWLTYAGYLLLQSQVLDAYKRRRYSAVFGILAFLNLPLVHYSIKWFGKTAHPMKFNEFSSDDSIVLTRWFAVLVFLIFYSLLFRWKLERERVHDRVSNALSTIRRLEEGVR